MTQGSCLLRPRSLLPGLMKKVLACFAVFWVIITKGSNLGL